MKEQLISFETAKLTKEKGFDLMTLCFYFEDKELREHKITVSGYMEAESPIEYDEFLEDWNNGYKMTKSGTRCFGCNTANYLETFSAPTQPLLQKWLREKHNIFVEININNISYAWSYTIWLKYPVVIDNKHENLFQPYFKNFRKNWSYEEALEEGLKYALSLIEYKKD